MEWKDVKGFKGYQVCKSGKIRSASRGESSGWVNDKYGHKKVRLSKGDGTYKDMYLHRLVAQAFIPNPQNKPDVNHIDNNPLNNDVNNLEWVTHKENMQHAAKQGRLKGKSMKVINIETKQTFDSCSLAAESIGMKRNTLQYKLNGKRPNETPFRWLKDIHNKLL
jgi:hypothetical protein